MVKNFFLIISLIFLWSNFCPTIVHSYPEPTPSESFDSGFFWYIFATSAVWVPSIIFYVKKDIIGRSAYREVERAMYYGLKPSMIGGMVIYSLAMLAGIHQMSKEERCSYWRYIKNHRNGMACWAVGAATGVAAFFCSSQLIKLHAYYLDTKI